MLSWTTLSGIPLLAGDPGTALLNKELDTSTVVLWGVCLLLGSFMGLAGALTVRWFHAGALLIERSGLILVGGAALVYTGVAWVSVPEPSEIAYVLGLQVGFGTACLWRCWQITKRLRWMKATRQEG
jgi:hypothetical protein